MSRIRAYKRQERKEQIILTLIMDYQRGQIRGRTMYKIARALDMRPSTHLMAIINELVEDGRLEKRNEPKVANIARYVYTLTPGTFEMPQAISRKIRLMNGGKVLGTLETDA